MSILAEAIPARAVHLWRVAADMREADVREIWLSSRSRPIDALRAGLRESRQCWTIMVDGMPAGMFGVADRSMLPCTGSPWLLGTDDLLRVRRRFVRECRDYVAQMAAGYELLTNYVHANNAASVRWLRWLGFEVSEPMANGFCRFEMKGNKAVNYV